MRSRFLNNTAQLPPKSDLAATTQITSRLLDTKAQPGFGSQAISRFTPQSLLQPQEVIDQKIEFGSKCRRRRRKPSLCSLKKRFPRWSSNSMKPSRKKFPSMIVASLSPPGTQLKGKVIPQNINHTSEQNFKQRIVNDAPLLKLRPARNTIIEDTKGFLYPISNQDDMILNPLQTRLDESGEFNQNLYRTSPFTKEFAGRNNLETFFSYYNNLPETIKEQLGLSKEYIAPKDLKKSEKEMLETRAQRLARGSDGFAKIKSQTFKDPPILNPFLTKEVDFQMEILALTQIASNPFNVNNKTLYEQFIKKFKQRFIETITKLKGKMQSGIRILDFIGTEYKILDENYKSIQLRHEEVHKELINFLLEGSLQDIQSKSYQQITIKSQTFCHQEADMIQQINNCLNMCQSQKTDTKHPKMPQNINVEEICKQMILMQKEIENIYVSQIYEINENIEFYFLYLRKNQEIVQNFSEDKQQLIQYFEQFQKYFIFIQQLENQFLNFVIDFTQFLMIIREEIKPKAKELLKFVSQFLKEGYNFDKMLTFASKEDKVLKHLFIGMAFIQGIKIPASAARNLQFNGKALANASISFNKGRSQLNKMIQKIIRTFPEEFQSELMDDFKRKELFNYFKKQIQQLKSSSIEEILNQPLFVLQKIECFQSVYNCYKEMLKKVDKVKEISDWFSDLTALENNIYEKQSNRERLKHLFHQTQNLEVVKEQQKEVNAIKENLQNILEACKLLDWTWYKVFCKTSEIPNQVTRLIQWLESEVVAVVNLEFLHQQYINGYSSDRQLQFEQAEKRAIQLKIRLQEIIKFEPTVDEIVNGQVEGSQEYKQTLLQLYQNTVLEQDQNVDDNPNQQPEDNLNTSAPNLDYSRIDQPFAVDQELEDSLNYIAEQQNNQLLSSNLRTKYKDLYEMLSGYYTKYQIWQQIQRCRCLMDGIIFGEIIKQSKIFIFDETLTYINITKAIKQMEKMIRGFNLNIKNNDQVVFFMQFVRQGHQYMSSINKHFEYLKKCSKLSYQEKKKINVEDLNKRLLEECSLILSDENSAISIIREPIYSALKYYIDINTSLFQTKASQIDWDKKIMEVCGFIRESNQHLVEASEYLEKIFRSSLLEQYQPPKLRQSKFSASLDIKITFGVEEFYVSAPLLFKIQITKSQILKNRLECENILKNQIDNDDYRVKYVYVISVIDDVLLWIRAIEKLAHAGYYYMGKVKDIIQFEEQITADYLRQMKLLFEEIGMMSKELKTIEQKSPFNFKLKQEQKTPPQPELLCDLFCAKKIDSQILLLLKMTKVNQQLLEILIKIVDAYLNFQNGFKSDQKIQIEEDFFDLLNRLVCFYLGTQDFEQNKKKQEEFAENPIVFKDSKIQFNQILDEIPSYCPFPKTLYNGVMQQYEPIFAAYLKEFNIESLQQLNRIIQEYKIDSIDPILSLTGFTEDVLSIMSIDVKYQKVLSNQIMEQVLVVCNNSKLKLRSFTEFLKEFLNVAQNEDIKQSKTLNQLEDIELMNQFLAEDTNHWQNFLRIVIQLFDQYKKDGQKKKYQKLDVYTKDLITSIVEIEARVKELKQNQSGNLQNLLQLYKSFQVLFESDYENQNL